MQEEYQVFNGLRFRRDKKSGYYLNSTICKRIHVYVWEYYNGKVPKGYEVHHIDGDKNNNNIENLMILTKSDHLKIHASQMDADKINKLRKNLSVFARPKAVEWHKSDEGRKWHKQHIEKQREKEAFQKEVFCNNCGTLFLTKSVKPNNFCCNACKSAFRRKNGADLIERKCAICGNVFLTNKYKQTKTCSNKCAQKYRWGKYES